MASSHPHWGQQGWALATATLLASCAAATNLPINIKQQHIGSQCGSHKQATISIIDSQDRLRELYRGLPRRTIGQSTTPPNVDFEESMVLQIGMGQKPTAGYSISLGQENSRLIDGKLLIHTHWQEPIRGRMLAQIITNPCLIIFVPKIEFDTIQVLDQAGNERINYRKNDP